MDESDSSSDANHPHHHHHPQQLQQQHQSTTPFSFFTRGKSSTPPSEDENRVGKEFHELSKMLISTAISLPRPRSDSNVSEQKFKPTIKVTDD